MYHVRVMNDDYKIFSLHFTATFVENRFLIAIFPCFGMLTNYKHICIRFYN